MLDAGGNKVTGIVSVLADLRGIEFSIALEVELKASRSKSGESRNCGRQAAGELAVMIFDMM